jgi:DNA-binding beta-propeller fold protein YncE
MARHLRFISVLLVALCFLAGARPAQAQDNGRGRHKQLYATPVPGQVTIDGKLDDWDLSGQIEMFVIEPTRNTMNAKFALMYDADAIYLSGDVRDTSPLMNRNNPAANPAFGWNADSCQFRMVLNPNAAYPEKDSMYAFREAMRAGRPIEDKRDDIVHLTLWHYTDTKTPALTIQKGMSYRLLREEWKGAVVPAEEYRAAYITHADGRGYTFEYRCSWALLGAQRPLTGGDTVAGTVQFNWSTPEGYKTAGGSAWSYDVLLKPGFPYGDFSCWGKLIFSKTGNVSQDLVLAGVPRPRPLPLEFRYTLPTDGWTTLQLEKTDGTVVRILVPQQERTGGENIERWDGLDDAGNLLPAGEYRWRGVTFKDKLRAEYRFSVHNSGQPPHPTDDGKGAWGGDHGTPQDVIAFGNHLLMVWDAAEYGSGTIRTDVEGRKQWGGMSGGTFLATDGTRYYTAGDHGFESGIGVRIFDVNTGRPVTLPDGRTERFSPPPGGENAVNHPTGLACHNGTLYIAYAARNLIALYSTTDGTLRATWNVPTPQRLAVRPDGVMLAVSDGKVLTVHDGKATPWLTTHLDAPRGIAVAADGTVFVANRGALQNVSVFNAQGRYLRSVGTQGGRPRMGRYDAAGMLEACGITLDAQGRLWVAETLDGPKRISVWDTRTGKNLKEFFGASGYFAYGVIDPARPNEIFAQHMLWDIDWAKYTVRPKSTAWRQTDPNMMFAPGPYSYQHVAKLMTTDNGQQYMWGHYRTGNVVHSILLRRDGDLFRPFAAILTHRQGHRSGIALLDADPTAFPYDAFFLWQDGNNDQCVQAAEVLRLPKNYERSSFIWMDDDLTVRLSNGQLWRPVTVTREGQPRYDVAQAEKGVAPMQHGYMARMADGAMISLQNGKGPSLVKRTADGTMTWNYPNLVAWGATLNMPIVTAGRLWAMTGLMGIAGDYFAHQNYWGPNHIFRTDGMYLGMVLQDGRLGGRGAYEGQPEGQGGNFVKLKIDGKERYFAIGGGGDVRVWEILGLDGIQDLPGGTLTHTAEDVATARAAKVAHEALVAGKREVRIVSGGKTALATAPSVTREVEGNRGFDVRVAYDATHLYVRFDVTTPHELSNSQADPRVIFRGGNLLDIQLATDPQADPARKTPAPGDLRLLITRQGGKPCVVLFQPKVAGFTGTPVVLTSPTGKESFDRISVVETIGLDYAKTGTGFTATVTIPQEAFGLKLAAGQQLKLDLGYIFGNRGGTNTAIRAYLYNNTFTANVVDDVPHESRLEPAEWKAAKVE